MKLDRWQYSSGTATLPNLRSHCVIRGMGAENAGVENATRSKMQGWK